MSTNPAPSTADELAAAVAQAVGALASVRDLVTQVPEDELASLFGHLARLRALAEGAALATLVEAVGRGTVARSDHPRSSGWAQAAARAAGSPITPSFASDLAKTARGTEDGGMARLLGAATSGRIGVHEAAPALREFAAMRRRIPAALWDTATDALVEYLADGAGVRRLAEAHEAIVASYGAEGEFEEKVRAQRAVRSFGDFRKDATGMYVATVRLDPDAHAAVAAVLDARSAPQTLPDGTTDGRDRPQRRADVFVSVMTHVGTDPTALPDTRPASAARAQLVVTVTAEQLDAHPRFTRTSTDGPRMRGFVTTETGQPLPLHVLDRLVCDAGLTPVVVDRPLAEGGHVLDVGRRFRLATARQRAALRVRDGGCTFPGCDAPPSWCEAHHVYPWALGGRTDVDDLALLCARHHGVVHANHYTATVTADGVTWHLERRSQWPDATTPRPRRGQHERGGRLEQECRRDPRVSEVEITGRPHTAQEFGHALRRAGGFPHGPGEFHVLRLDYGALLALEDASNLPASTPTPSGPPVSSSPRSPSPRSQSPASESPAREGPPSSAQ